MIAVLFIRGSEAEMECLRGGDGVMETERGGRDSDTST